MKKAEDKGSIGYKTFNHAMYFSHYKGTYRKIVKL